MIASYKRKANIAGAICLVAVFGPIVLVRVLAWTGHKVLRDTEDVTVLAIAIVTIAMNHDRPTALIDRVVHSCANRFTSA